MSFGYCTTSREKLYRLEKTLSVTFKHSKQWKNYSYIVQRNFTQPVQIGIIVELSLWSLTPF